MTGILELLEKKIVIWDGGMGSMLIDIGLKRGMAPELWNKKNPEQIGKIHRRYYKAGADVIQTNTFGGNRLKLEACGIGDEAYTLNFAGAKIAREICPANKFVAGNIGPTGKFLEPIGNYSFKDFKKIFAEQAAALRDGDVDMFSIETMMDSMEAKAAIDGIKSVTDLPIAAMMSYNKTKRGFYTIMGNSIKDCMNVLIKSGADIVGSNCSLDSNDMVDLVINMKQYLDKQQKNYPLIAQANAGQPTIINDTCVYPIKPDRYLLDVITMIKNGINAVGGCCGTSPDYIKKISEYVEKYQTPITFDNDNGNRL
jgi:methionine synthase I (cobalamin-dependent)